MKLRHFEVSDFRSVRESGTIETGTVTALIGVNESGKSNLLLPLWKFKPANDGEIKPTADYPRKLYNDFRTRDDKPVFIDCSFEPSEEMRAHLASLTGSPAACFQTIRARRKLDGKYYISFPGAAQDRLAETSVLRDHLISALNEIEAIEPAEGEQEYVAAVLGVIGSAIALVPDETLANADHLRAISAALMELQPVARVEEFGEEEPANIVESNLGFGEIGLRYQQLRGYLAGQLEAFSRPNPNDNKEARRYALNELPHFVYYTNYGNLDSEIYLPHVIANMSRTDLGAKEEAKVRTLKVLFEFVGLKPEEILELGKDFKVPANRQPTEGEITDIAEKKKERSILMQAASTKLTKEFREWWKQGEYHFRFEADGDHFRIWVSDDKRAEEIELEGRSTGLQWFLSCYLVLAVESRGKHAGSILLLDEPGMSLHPLAQRDLSRFFDDLSGKNQLIYTTHSPFLVDAGRLDRARKVYISADGSTRATPDLRFGEHDRSQRASGYAVHAALGLTVAESLLLGCMPVVVEGVADQIYLSAIKTLLIAAGRIRPRREVVFQAVGRVEGLRAAATLLAGREDDLPYALYDNDAEGDKVSEQLRLELYADAPDRVLQVGRFITGISGEVEIEDLLPGDLMAQAVDRLYRKSENLFADSYKTRRPIVPQIEAWAHENGVHLDDPLWKVELAKRVKQSLLNQGVERINEYVVDQWQRLFEALLGTTVPVRTAQEVIVLEPAYQEV